MKKLPDNACTYWQRQAFRECDDFGCSPYSVMNAEQAERHHDALEVEDEDDPPCNCCDACHPDPEVTFLGTSGNSWRFRLVGGPIADEWLQQIRPPESAWCEISVGAGARPGIMGVQVVSWGGATWPSAWPHMFLAAGRGVVLTDEGASVLHHAILDAMHAEASS